MKELELSPDQKEEYDKILREMRKELEQIPQPHGNTFSYEMGNRPYQEISDKYMPLIQKVIDGE